jgi:hypothetical protein
MGMVEAKTHYMHLPIGGGRVTVAVRSVTGTLTVGFSWCSPRDQFVKAKGRQIAEARRRQRRRPHVDTEYARNFEPRPNGAGRWCTVKAPLDDEGRVDWQAVKLWILKGPCTDEKFAPGWVVREMTS